MHCSAINSQLQNIIQHVKINPEIHLESGKRLNIKNKDYDFCIALGLKCLLGKCLKSFLFPFQLRGLVTSLFYIRENYDFSDLINISQVPQSL